MRLRTVILLAFAAMLIGAGAAAQYFWLGAPAPFESPRVIDVKHGESFRTVATELADAGVVRSSTVALLYGEFTGGARQIKPGEYEFRGGERVPEVLRHLVAGDALVVTVAIPEGLTMREIAERLQSAGLVCESDFLAAARDGPIAQALGLGPLGTEGYLFPATYRFSPHATVDEILTAMLARFYSVLTPQVEQRMFDSGLDARELVTMASIIEKEAKAAGERPLIASVFYNRLRLGIPLQSDPTAEYDMDAGMTAAESVRIASTFNTYLRAGLPPGPIANPGLSSIQAALYPAQSNFLYFVARDDGTHVFSRSFAEHKHNVEALRRIAARRAPLAEHHAQ